MMQTLYAWILPIDFGRLDNWFDYMMHYGEFKVFGNPGTLTIEMRNE